MDLKDYIHSLNNIPLFKNFTEEDLFLFFERFDYKLSYYGKEGIIFIENEKCLTFNIILDGKVEIQKIDSLGKILVITEFYPGDTLGENLLFGKSNRFPMSGIAKTKTTILSISKESVLHLCQKDKVFLAQFLGAISDKAITLSQKLKQVTLKTIRQRICQMLIKEYRASNSLQIQLNMKKKDWADKMGVQRPSLSRELIKMKEDGLIDYDRQYIYIRDLNGIKNSL